MARKSIITLFALLSLLIIVTGAFADTYQSATQAGAFTTDNKNAVNISISVSKYTITGSSPSTSGYIQIAGITGLITSSIVAQPSDIQFATTSINGKNYNQATITTKVFVYVDLRTGRRTQAWAQFIVTQYGRGRISYHVYSTDDGAVVSGSLLASGTIGDISLNAGSTSIRP